RLIGRRALVIAVYATICVALLFLVAPRLGSEIFPRVDAGQLQLRIHAPAGSRFEHTEEITQQTLQAIQKEVGSPAKIEASLAFVGVQPSSYPINVIHLWTGGPDEAVLHVQLKHGTGIHI